MAPAAEVSAGPVPVVERSFVIAIDPGHGGDNGGCVAFDGAIHEKDLTLAMAHELQASLLRRLPHARVVLTRAGDETVTLADRVARANAAGADLLLSLHANASGHEPQTGFETYVLDLGLDRREAARSARVEDGAEPTRARALAMVRELALSSHRGRAAGFARRVQQEQAQRFPERIDRGVKQAGFDVLMGAEMPAVLFEAGFLDHPEEGRRLLDSGQRALVVDGLTEAIVDYYREHARER
ncbi:MAG: N-acetylmuramoyl-L-alanine amidase [Myxococcales bacterium]|nr:N-acetylmuramoyl-L-alanine amidase [Myxococcales bacterium]MCB9713399.1 N-acetylmuramoyl-L-alanine amidase [Myxococcales bacterium]